MRKIKDRSKKGGIITGVIAGIGGLVILIVITLVIISTILNANLLKGTGVTTVAVEQTALNSSQIVYTLDLFNGHNHDFTIVSVKNANGSLTILPANYTFYSTLGTITNATATNFDVVNISYTYIKTTNYEDTTTGMAENLTAGIANVSSKLPTILLIAAVVLLLSVLAFLVVKSRQLTSIGGGEVSGRRGGGSSIENPSSSGVGGVGGSL